MKKKKSFAWKTEIWDYKNREEFEKHLPIKRKQRFFVFEKYESKHLGEEGITVEYRQEIKP